MTVLIFLAVSVAGGVGSALRYLTDNAIPVRIRRRFPWGTAIVNLTGSLLLGIVTGAATVGLPDIWAEVLGVGLLGGYTTLSTASVDTVRLVLEHRNVAALANAFGMLLACVALAMLGFALVAA